MPNADPGRCIAKDTDVSKPDRQGMSGFLSGTTADRPPQAVALLVGALFLLGLQDGLAKFTSSEVSLWQFQAIRSTANLILLAIVTRIVWGTAGPRPQNIWAVTLRSLLLAAAMILFFGGMPFLTLAEIAAGLYVFPLFVAVLSAILLGERVGPRRIAAILVGFTGTLLILKPGTDAFRPVSLMPVCAALCYAGTILTTRRLCRTESPVTLAYGVSFAFLGLSALGLLAFAAEPFEGLARAWPYLFTGWNPLEIWVLAIILGCSFLNLSANIGLAKAYQNAEASWLAPFDYSYLIFATFWGFALWRHVPDALTFLGMAMIAGAGVFVAWRERRDAKSRAENFPRPAP